MKPYISLVFIFLAFNFVVGRLFQESLSLVCFIELGIIAITSIIFWVFSIKSIKVVAQKFNFFSNPKHLLLHGGVGVSMAMINILFGHVFIVLIMTYIFDCTSPSFNIINASLTNNIAVNTSCYFGLIIFFHYRAKDLKEKDVINDSCQLEELKKIKFTNGNTSKLISVEDIKFIETSKNCIVIHTTLGKFVKYQSLKSFLSENFYENLKRVHRSHAVNIDYIDSFKKNKNGDGIITLKDKSNIKFSRNYNLNVL